MQVPVEFHNTTSYSCNSDSVFFSHDRDAEEWNLTCLESGSWQVPEVWPACIHSESAVPPVPPKVSTAPPLLPGRSLVPGSGTEGSSMGEHTRRKQLKKTRICAAYGRLF